MLTMEWRPVVKSKATARNQNERKGHGGHDEHDGHDGHDGHDDEGTRAVWWKRLNRQGDTHGKRH